MGTRSRPIRLAQLGECRRVTDPARPRALPPYLLNLVERSVWRNYWVLKKQADRTIRKGGQKRTRFPR